MSDGSTPLRCQVGYEGSLNINDISEKFIRFDRRHRQTKRRHGKVLNQGPPTIDPLAITNCQRAKISPISARCSICLEIL